MTDKYHNVLGGASADQLRAYVTRIERIEAEISELNAGKKDVYHEAKNCGFCKDTMRKVVARRRRNRQELTEADEMLELYETVLTSTDLIT